MRVGFIGLGNIGMPMAKTLLSAGFDLTVYNRSRGKAEEMEALGAKGCLFRCRYHWGDGYPASLPS